MAIFNTLRGAIHKSISHKLQNCMEVDSVGIIAIFSMSYITTRIVKTDKCGKNLQSARRKPNYHTKCSKNCRVDIPNLKINERANVERKNLRESLQ